MSSYKDKKVITIGIVNELTGLSVRMIRYYEERGLIFPERSERGTRKYSFADIELLLEIANKREEGVQTYEIKQDMLNEKKNSNVRDKLRRGQFNAHFNMRK
ncbi:MerR family transcriptional regulator [Thalassobacillus sp. CUG 92003]|uniref:MerR family transcriptional regulator n=1 Tax=Thalassobacillus sp. CUG 92003 TaxID=2736641 RepID=UPI0015E6EB68|nr:MerR family transcriptional regulator [Thalassobacillus sp. CUG 92003]